MKQKIYLEPRSQFDTCISHDLENAVTYNTQKIINMLAAQFASEGDKSCTDHNWVAQEWFDYNIWPLGLYYNINFTQEESYENL
jgi:hypothetical protein